MNKNTNGKIRKRLAFLALASLLVSIVLGGCSVPDVADALSSGIISQDIEVSEPAEIIGGADEETSVVIVDEPEEIAVTEESEPEPKEIAVTEEPSLPEGLPEEGEFYYDVENVVLYLELYHELPLNYITKKEAEKRGWQGGSVEDYVEDAAIGGDHFGNYEGLLPKDDYKECDIDTHNYKNRGSRRLIYTDDGKYYYTKNHYESFAEVTVDDNYKVTIH